MNEVSNRNVYHTMEIKIAQIAARYLLCKQFVEEKEYVCSSGEKDSENFYSSYIYRVEKAYDDLEGSHREIINNDFFYQNYPNWWQSFYSKSSYYRIKNAAMKKFLRTFANA